MLLYIEIAREAATQGGQAGGLNCLGEQKSLTRNCTDQV